MHTNTSYSPLFSLNDDRIFLDAFYTRTSTASHHGPTALEARQQERCRAAKLQGLRHGLSRLLKIDPIKDVDCGKLTHAYYSIPEILCEFVKLAQGATGRLSPEDLYVARFTMGTLKHYLEPSMRAMGKKNVYNLVLKKNQVVLGKELANEISQERPEILQDIHATAKYLRDSAQPVRETRKRNRRHEQHSFVAG